MKVSSLKSYVLMTCMCLICIAYPPFLCAEDTERSVIELYNKGVYPVTEKIQIMHDNNNVMTIDEVIAAEEQGQFKASDSASVSLGVLEHPIWISLDVSYPDRYPNTTQDKEWYLEISTSLLDEGYLYQLLDNGRIIETRSDVSLAFSERDFNHAYSVFPISFSLGETKRLYLKLKTSGTYNFQVNIWQPGEYFAHESYRKVLFGLFLGAMLAIILYNSFIYFVDKDVAYLFYVSYLAGITLLFYIQLGYGVDIFDEGGSVFKKSYLPFLIWFNWIAVCLFMRSFVGTQQQFPTVDRFLVTTSRISGIYLIVGIFVPAHDALIVSASLTPVFLFFIAIFAVFCWRAGSTEAYYFFLAWIFNIFALSVYALSQLGYIPVLGGYTTVILVFGLLSEAILLSFALAQKVKRIQQQWLHSSKELENSMALYKERFEEADDGIYQLSLSGRFIKINNSMARILGYDTLKALQNAEAAAFSVLYKNPAVFYQQLLDKNIIDEELAYTKKCGDAAWCYHAAKFIYDDSGNPSHIEGSLSDITEQKLREIVEIKKEKEEKEEIFAKRVLAEKIGFLTNMSFKIRSYLTSIIGHSESIKKLELSGSDKEDSLKIIGDSSQRLLHLINDILDFSKIQAGKFQLEAIQIELTDLLFQVLNNFTAELKHKGIVCSIDYMSKVPKVIISDPTRIQYILTNIIHNIVSHTNNCDLRIKVWCFEKSSLQVTITDNNRFISQVECDALFDVFPKSGDNAILKYGYSHLGLAISRELALLLGGKLEVQRTENSGVTFLFSFKPSLPPRCEWSGPFQGLNKIEQKTTEEKQLTLNLSGSVLLAEDNKVNQLLIKKMITATGVSVTIVENGRLAVDEACNSNYDLILMDINMPEMDGLEATQILRKKNIKAPIYALTAETDGLVLEKAIKSGCCGCLQKPVDREELFAVLEARLQPAC